MADPDQRQNNEVDPGNQNGGGQDNRNGNENGNGADGGAGLLGFAQMGEIFNDATSRPIGGVDDSNKAIVVEDLTAVQSALRDLLAAEPEAFQGTAAIRAQSVIDQINLELAAVNSLGDDPFAPQVHQ